MNNSCWWNENSQFFGEFYMDGDNSQQGHLSEKLSLYERTVREANGVAKLLNLTHGNNVLDIPCGYGRHSIELSKRGLRVVGVDLNMVHLNRASKEAFRQGLSIDFRQGNMLEVDYMDTFDAVINMFYSFGFFATDEENVSVLRKFYAALKDGGKLLMHTDVNIARIRSHQYKESETRTLVSGGILHITDHFDSATRRIHGTWTITKLDGTVATKDYSVRVYEKDEFCEMCLQVGFKRCVAYGNWEGEAYSEDSEEIVFVATK